MSDRATQRIVEAVERAIRQVMPASLANPTVDIVTDGIRKLVYINGQRIDGVLDIELPVKNGEFGPQINLRLHADEIVQRTVSADEFKQMLHGSDAAHKVSPPPPLRDEKFRTW